MFDPVEDIADFHRKFGLAYHGEPRQLPEELARFRIMFMAEELAEYVTEDEALKKLIQSVLITRTGETSLEKQFDALIDLCYVLLGTAHLHGFDFREGWRRVHAANMTKVRARRPEDSKRSSAFDVVKPTGWIPPDLSDLVSSRAVSPPVGE